jgi:hypothetical protein
MLSLRKSDNFKWLLERYFIIDVIHGDSQHLVSFVDQTVSGSQNEIR